MSKFAKTFHTYHDTVKGMNGEILNSKEVNGKEFIVIDEVNKYSHDYDYVGTVYIVEFGGGLLVEAFANEILEDLQVNKI